MTAATTWVRRPRAAVAASATVTLIAAGLVTYAVMAEGYTARHADLNDGGVWVTNNSEGLFGRLNKPISQLDAGFYPPGGAQAAYTVDVVQDAGTVLAWDKGSGKLYPVDVRNGTPNATQAAGVAGDDRIELAGGTAAVLDPSSGKLWAARMSEGDTSGLAKLDSAQKPVLTAGGAADLAVGTDGTIYVASATSQRLYTLQPTDVGFSAPVKTSLGRKMRSLHVTAVGDTPVVLDAGSAAVLLPGKAPVALPQAGPDAVLQQPGADAADVMVATATSLLRVPLDGRAPTVAFSGGTGTPARPVRLGACDHAAWGGSPGRYARSCNGSAFAAQKLPSTAKVTQPVFRVNRDQLVLNDLNSGAVWIVDDVVRQVDDWQAVRRSKPLPQNNKPTKPDKTIHPAAQNRPPIAKPDDLGARPGRTTALNVLDNDADPDNDTLVITAVTALDDPTSPVSIAADGQSLQIALSPAAQNAVHFRYTISDGKGQSSSTDVTIEARTANENEPPHLWVGYKATPLSVAAGGTTSVSVVSNWRDFDGDPLTITTATAPSGTVAVTGDGGLVYSAPTDAGAQQVRYRISDGVATPVEGTQTINVLKPNSTDAVAARANPDVVRAVVGRPVTVSPLANDTPGADPSDPTTQMSIAAPVAQPIGATVSTDLTDGTVTVTAKRAGTTLLNYRVSFGAAKLASGVVRVDAIAPSTHPSSPVAMPDTAMLRGQEAATVDVLANDYDPSGQVLVVQRAEPTDPESGLQVAVIQGRWLRIGSASATTSGVRFVRYTITDGSTAAVTGQVAVVQVPAADSSLPPLPTDDSATVRAGDYVDVPVLDNDVDPNGDLLRLKPVRSAGLTEGRLNTTPALGNAYIAGNVVRYEAPATVAAPTQVLVDYVVADSSGASAVGHVQVTVNPLPTDASQDQPPAPKAVQRTVVAGDQLVITVPSTGVDPDGDSVSIVGLAGPPQLGRVTAIGPTTITYQSYPLAGGTDTFGYTVTDRYGQTATAQIRIGVVPPGDPQPPVAVDDQVTAAPGSTVHVAVLGNDYVAPDDTASVQPLDTANEPVPSGTSLDKDRVAVKTSPANGKPLVVSYKILGGTGASSTAQVIVDGQNDFDNPPVTRTDVAKPAVGATTTTVDALANDDDPDGNSSDLKISKVFLPGTQVTGGRITIPLQAYAQAVTYEVVDKGGASSLGVVNVPASGGGTPGLRPNVSPIQMATNSTKTVNIADYVVDPAGKKLQLTTTDRIWSSPSNVLGVSSKSSTSLALTSRAGYTGPAAVIFEITNGALSDPKAQQVVVSVPVQIGNSQPVLRCPDTTLTAVQGGPTLSVDLLTVCHIWVQDEATLAQVNVATAWTKPIQGVNLAKVGNAGLTITPTAQARAGTSGRVSIVVPGTSAKATLNVRVIAAPPPSVSAMTIRGLKAGQSQTLDVRAYTQTPLRGPSISVVSAAPATQQGVSVAVSGSRITVSAAAGGTHGTMTYGLVVTDVTGVGHDDRHVSATLTVQVLGLPGTPGRPSVVQTLSHTAVVAFSPPAANGAVLDQIQLLDNHGGTHSCPASPCTVGGLRNNTAYRFTVRAHNVVGYGPASPASAAVTPDTKPGAVVGVTATPGDTAATVRWNALQVDGSPVSSYQLLISPAPESGSGAVTLASTSTVVRGLANGTSYSFRVKAQNKKGFGPLSTPAKTIPFGTPVAPAAPQAGGTDVAGGNSQKAIAVSWTPPSDNGNGRPVTHYYLTPYKDSAAQPVIDEGTSLSATFTVPNDGATWTYTVAAANSEGRRSPPSARSAPPVDASSKPDQMAAPTATVADNAPNQAVVSYTAPNANGSAITNVIITDSGGTSHTCGANGPCTITGLQDGTAYTFTSHAVNKNGSGAESGASNAVTPYYSPTPVPKVTAQKNGQDVDFTWNTPNGSDPTISCSVTWTGGGSSNQCSGSSSANVGYSSTGKITVTVSDIKGRTQTRTASDTTDPKPPDPKTVTLSAGRSAVGQPNCVTQWCHYLHVSISNGFSSGTHDYACYENGSRFDWGTVSIASGGSTDLPCYNGNTYAVYATIDGVASNTVHPKPDWP